MKPGDMVTFDEKPSIRVWLSPNPEPMTHAEKLSPVSGGEILVLLEIHPNQFYSRVLTTNGVSGWIHTGYLRRLE